MALISNLDIGTPFIMPTTDGPRVFYRMYPRFVKDVLHFVCYEVIKGHLQPTTCLIPHNAQVIPYEFAERV